MATKNSKERYLQNKSSLTMLVICYELGRKAAEFTALSLDYKLDKHRYNLQIVSLTQNRLTGICENKLAHDSKIVENEIRFCLQNQLVDGIHKVGKNSDL